MICESIIAKLVHFDYESASESATLNIAKLFSRIAVLGREGIITPFALEEGKVLTTLERARERGIYYRIVGYRISGNFR